MGYGYGPPPPPPPGYGPPPPPPPPPGYGPPPPPGYGHGYPPSNHMVWSILTALFCCQIGGIIAIVYSSQVNSKFHAGDHYGAVDASNKAKTWNLVSLGVGFLWIGWWLLYFFIIAADCSDGYC